MSVQKRSIKSAPQRIKRVPTLAEICNQLGARDALKQLTDAGADAKMLKKLLAFAVFVHLMPAAKVFDIKGMSRKSVNSIPIKMRKLASDLESIRKAPQYALALGLWFPTTHNRVVADLRAYARVLEDVTCAFRYTSLRNPRKYNLKLFSKRRMIEHVTTTTGKPRYRLLVDLLNAAYGAADLEILEEESNLRHLWENNLKSSKSQGRYIKKARVMAD